MLNQPRFKGCFRVEKVEPQTVFLLSERTSICLNDPIYLLLISLIDGHRTAESIVSEMLPFLLPKQPSFEDIIQAGTKAYYALGKMKLDSYLVESNEDLSPEVTSFCETLNIDIVDAKARLETTKVVVKSIGSVQAEQLITILESLGIQVSTTGDLEIILTDDYLQQDLHLINQQRLEANQPWMLTKPVGTVIWLGPIFSPGKTGCWQCLAQRLENNRPVERFIHRQNQISTPLTPPLKSLLPTLQIALGMIATEIFKWIIQGKNPKLEGRIVTYDSISLAISNHTLIKRPQCVSCGDGGKNSKPQPIVLQSCPKTFTVEGGHRCKTPQQTLREYQHHISPITGVVRELEKFSSHKNNLTHTYVAKHHFSAIKDDLTSLHQNLNGRSAGKGQTDEQAKVSSFCEAIERYSISFQGNENRLQASYYQLGDKAIDPNQCMNFSPLQYNDRREWNSRCSSLFQQVPEPFNKEREIEWTPVWSLTAQDFKYLPTAYCYHGYPNPWGDCWSDTNGCATGNTLEEAILQGFLELVERDCVALWWYNCLKKPAVELDSFEKPYFQQLKNYYHSIHRDLWVLDLTSDLKIPTFAAITRRTDREVEDIVLGFGSHFDPMIAIGRALVEVNQILPAVLSVNQQGNSHYLSYDSLAIEWWKTATLDNKPYLGPDKNLPVKVANDYSHRWENDLLEDVMTCQKIAEDNNLEMLVLDQTRADIGLNVVKVIVPGMRHWWKRLGSGRLYEVPVKMGWLSKPLTETQLNSFPMWM
ncbi:MAG TPA: adenylate cyclase [Cyanothece sp. UBA12306]|nr:adenylate cyclase [Cyanothece sp. UBA12306]